MSFQVLFVERKSLDPYFGEFQVQWSRERKEFKKSEGESKKGRKLEKYEVKVAQNLRTLA